MPGQLRLGAGLLGDGRARAAGADREALEEAGQQIGGADARQLLVGVDLVAAPRGEAGRGGDRVADGNERNPSGRGEQQRQRRQVDARQARRGKALRQGADDVDAFRRQVEQDDRQDGHDDRGQHARNPRVHTLEPEDQHQVDQADRQREEVRLAQALPGRRATSRRRPSAST